MYNANMMKIYAIILGLILVILGLAGFYHPNIYNVIHLDLWLSFVYLITGAIGLKLGLDKKTNQLNLYKYISVTTGGALILVLFGLTFPNFYDIFHLEMTENGLHLIIGVAGSLVNYYSKPV